MSKNTRSRRVKKESTGKVRARERESVRDLSSRFILMTLSHLWGWHVLQVASDPPGLTAGNTTPSLILLSPRNITPWCTNKTPSTVTIRPVYSYTMAQIGHVLPPNCRPVSWQKERERDTRRRYRGTYFTTTPYHKSLERVFHFLSRFLLLFVIDWKNVSVFVKWGFTGPYTVSDQECREVN